MAAFHFIRPLGVIEHLHYGITCIGGVRAVTGVMLSRPFDVGLLKQAIARAPDIYHVLGTAIHENSSGQPYFADPLSKDQAPVVVAPIRMLTVGEEREGESRVGSFDDALNQCFSDRYFPLHFPFAVALLHVPEETSEREEHWMLLSLHHSVFDGISSIALVRVLFQLYAAVATANDPQPHPFPHPQEWPKPIGAPYVTPPSSAPPSSSVIPSMPEPGYLLWRGMYSVENPNTDSSADGICIPLDSRSTHTLRRTFPPDLIEKLKVQCRLHGTTIHGALTAAVLVAYRVCAQRMAETQAQVLPEALPLSIFQNFSLRALPKDQPPILPSQIGDWVSAGPITHTISAASDLWAIAQEAKKCVSELVQHYDLESPILRMLITLFTNPDLMGPMLANQVNKDHGRQNNISLSNLGTVALDKYEERLPSPLEVYCFINQAARGQEFWISCMTILPEGKTALSICYPHPLISDELACLFLSTLLELLNQMASTKSLD